MSKPTLVTFKKQREKIVNLVSGAEQKFFGKEQKFFSFNTWKFFSLRSSRSGTCQTLLFSPLKGPNRHFVLTVVQVTFEKSCLA